MARVDSLAIGAPAWMLGALAIALCWFGCVTGDPHRITDPGGSGAGGSTACSSPEQCPGEDATCRQRSCTAGTCDFNDAPAHTPCSDAAGVVCDGMGQCVVCVDSEDCADVALACIGGRCVPASCTDGVMSSGETDIDCGGAECPPCDNGSACLGAADCASLYCELGGGRPGICAACSADTDCEPYACDAGICLVSCMDGGDCENTNHCVGSACVPKDPLGDGCTGAGSCVSGFCADGVCCDAACAGGCETCDGAGSCTSLAVGAPGTPSCSPYLCDGAAGACPSSCIVSSACAPGFYCDGTSCLAKKALGAVCTNSGECQSGQCVDGVCCNTACINACDACNLAGNLGSCQPRPDGAAGDPPCDPYLCNGIATCPASCVVAADCIAGHYCGGSQCQPLAPLGSACAAAVECQSGMCVDGRCCDSACGGSCDRCNDPANLGICTLLIAGTAGSPSCAPYVCDGGAAVCPMSCVTNANCVSTHYCNGMNQCVVKKSNGATCAVAAECQSAFCVDGRCCNNACNGSCNQCDLAGSEGTCLPSPPGAPGNPTCSPYVCNGAGAGCPSACINNSNCATGFTCDVTNQCVP